MRIALPSTLLAILLPCPAVLAGGDVRIFSITDPVDYTCNQSVSMMTILVKNNYPSTPAANVRVTLALSPKFLPSAVCAGGGYSGNTCTNPPNQFYCAPYDVGTSTITCTISSLSTGDKYIYIQAPRHPDAVDFYIAAGVVAEGTDDDLANNWKSYRFTGRRQGDIFNEQGPPPTETQLPPGDNKVALNDLQYLANFIVWGWANSSYVKSYIDFVNTTEPPGNPPPPVVDVLDLVYLQNYLVGNVPCLPRLYGGEPSLRAEDSRQALSAENTAAGSSSPVTVADAEGTAQIRVGQAQALSNGDSAHDLQLDLRSVRGGTAPIELGGFLLRISFDTSQLEYTGPRGAAGFDVMAGSLTKQANTEGVVRIGAIIPPAKRQSGKGLVALPTAMFRPKGRGPAGPITVTVEQAYSQIVTDANGSRAYRIGVR